MMVMARPHFPIEDVSLTDIYVGDRLRPVDPAFAEAMATSLQSGSRLPPIIVRRPEPGEGIDEPFALVIGGHRHAAAKLAGLDAYRAEISDWNRLEARLEEVKENLVRSELIPLDRAIFIAEHKRVWELLHPDAGRGGDRRSKKATKVQALHFGPRTFSAEVAERCGVGERTVKYALALVRNLSPEAVALLRGTEWSRNAAELQRLAAEPAERQVRLATIHAQGGADSVAKARIAAGDAPTGEGDPQEELFRRIVANWERLDAKQRRRFLEHAGLTPIVTGSAGTSRRKAMQ